MKQLHILRSADCTDAVAVIQAQLDSNVPLTVVLEGDQAVPTGTTVYSLREHAADALPGTEPINQHDLVGLIFTAESVVIW